MTRETIKPTYTGPCLKSTRILISNCRSSVSDLTTPGCRWTVTWNSAIRRNTIDIRCRSRSRSGPKRTIRPSSVYSLANVELARSEPTTSTGADPGCTSVWRGICKLEPINSEWKWENGSCGISEKALSARTRLCLNIQLSSRGKICHSQAESTTLFTR